MNKLDNKNVKIYDCNTNIVGQCVATKITVSNFFLSYNLVKVVKVTENKCSKQVHSIEKKNNHQEYQINQRVVATKMMNNEKKLKMF